MATVEPVVKKSIEDMEPAVVTYILKEYSQFLKLNLAPYFEEARVEDLKTSPFDDILNSE